MLKIEFSYYNQSFINNIRLFTQIVSSRIKDGNNLLSIKKSQIRRDFAES